MARPKSFNDFIIKENYAIMLVPRKGRMLQVLLDVEDVDKVKQLGKWCSLKDKTLKETSYYIVHWGKNYQRLHRFIMNTPKDKEIDHINHNTLDNRKCNLKICTRFENQQNLSSKVTEQTGVYSRRGWKGKLIWVSNITKNGKCYYKEFSAKEEAVQHRKMMEKQLYKELINEHKTNCDSLDGGSWPT